MTPPPADITSMGSRAFGAVAGAAKSERLETAAMLRRFAWQVVLTYAGVAALWIASSDWLLGELHLDPDMRTRVATLKGWLFVAATAAMLYAMLWRGLQRLQQATLSRIESQSELRQWADAFANCAHGIAISDPQSNRIRACNPAFARLHGREVDEVVGTAIFERYEPALHETVRRHLAIADQTGHVSYEAPMRRKDGTRFDMQMDVVTVRDTTGELLYRVATMQDITTRKRAEQALRESESSMALAQRVGGFGSWELEVVDGNDGRRNVLHWSDHCYRIFGYAPSEVPPTVRLYLRHVHPEERGELIKRARHALRAGERFESEHRVVLRGGDVRHVRGVGEVICDSASGRRKLVGTVHDVTARIRAATALRESEERFRAVVENIHEVFWMSDPTKSRVYYVSPSYEQVWGRTPASLYEAPASWSESVHPDDRERVRNAALSKQVSGDYDEEYRVVRPDGQTRWVRDKAFPVKNAHGRVERIVGVAEDTTERKTLEAQFLRAQRMEAIGTLAGGIAHDLNNILAPMLMAAGLLKENARDSHDREMLAMVERGARRGSEIIRQLLTFSRGVSGERVPIEFRHLLKEMGAIVRETFPREITLAENTPRELWPVVADATQLHQVLVNLCVNARDAMPHGGKLSLFAENVVLTESDRRIHPDARTGSYVMFGVADTGMGIAPELMERIFDPFFTTKDLGKGTGLGLSTVLGIVRSHGGFVTVESKVGVGSTFRVHLPAAAPVPMAENAVPTIEALPSGLGELVLVVDDEESIREATRHVLEKHNYRVITASNGKEAVSRFLQQRQSVRLVLTDMMMPEMGGTALIRALRLLNPSLKVVATSGLQPEGNADELAKFGIKEVLPKPCGARTLLEAVQRQLA